MTVRSQAARPLSNDVARVPVSTAVDTTRNRYGIVVAVGMMVAISLGGVLAMPLAEPDEARYAETARLMLITGDWIVPHLGGEVFLDKPPLLYWLSALSLRTFGISDTAARLPVFVAALCCLAIVFRQAKRSFDRDTAWLAVAILASSPLFFGFGQLLTMDMLLTAWTTAGMAALWFGSRPGGRAWIRIAYLVSAFGALSKGPIAVVLIWLPGLLYFVARRDLASMKRWWDPAAAIAFAAICAPWFWLVETRQPGFASSFLWHHHFERFMNPWHHSEPAWFFVPVGLVGMLPWSILWVFDPIHMRSVMADLRRDPRLAYLACCAVVPFVLFSLSSSKLIPYVLPALPPLAILLALVYTRALQATTARVLSRGGTFVAVGGTIALTVGLLFYAWVPHWRIPILRPLLVLGGAALLATGSACRILTLRGFRAAALNALLLGIASLLFMVQIGRGELAKEFRTLTTEVRIQTPKETAVWSIGEYRPAVDFYLGKPVEVVEWDQLDGRSNEVARASAGRGLRPDEGCRANASDPTGREDHRPSATHHRDVQYEAVGRPPRAAQPAATGCRRTAHSPSADRQSTGLSAARRGRAARQAACIRHGAPVGGPLR